MPAFPFPSIKNKVGIPLPFFSRRVRIDRTLQYHPNFRCYTETRTSLRAYLFERIVTVLSTSLPFSPSILLLQTI